MSLAPARAGDPGPRAEYEALERRYLDLVRAAGETEAQTLLRERLARYPAPAASTEPEVEVLWF